MAQRSTLTRHLMVRCRPLAWVHEQVRIRQVHGEWVSMAQSSVHVHFVHRMGLCVRPLRWRVRPSAGAVQGNVRVGCSCTQEGWGHRLSGASVSIMQHAQPCACGLTCKAPAGSWEQAEKGGGRPSHRRTKNKLPMEASTAKVTRLATYGGCAAALLFVNSPSVVPIGECSRCFSE